MIFRIIFFGIYFSVMHTSTFAQNNIKSAKNLITKNEINSVQKEELGEDMDRFMGFGFHFAVSRDEKNAETQNREWKLSDGFNLKFGVKLPKYLKTKPPEKLIAMDYKIFPLKK